MVFAFDAYMTPAERYRSYAMQDLLYTYIDKLGKPLPAKCKGNPDMYMLCKESKNELSIGIWNFFADAVEKPIIELSANYNFAEFINCDGEIKDNKLYLSRIPAYEFAFIRLTK